MADEQPQLAQRAVDTLEYRRPDDPPSRAVLERNAYPTERFVAALVDILIFWGGLAGVSTVSFIITRTAGVDDTAWVLPAAFALWVVFNFVLDAVCGFTIGRWSGELIVATVQGTSPTVTQCTVRAFAQRPWGVPVLWLMAMAMVEDYGSVSLPEPLWTSAQVTLFGCAAWWLLACALCGSGRSTLADHLSRTRVLRAWRNS